MNEIDVHLGLRCRFICYLITTCSFLIIPSAMNPAKILATNEASNKIITAPESRGCSRDGMEGRHLSCFSIVFCHKMNGKKRFLIVRYKKIAVFLLTLHF